MELRTDVKFHNGDPFTAETVKANVERIINPENKIPQRGNWEAIDQIEVAGPNKVLWYTKKPYPVFAERLQNLQFVSEKVLKEKGPAFLAENAIGTGPYKFVKWDRGQQIVMERNEEYWGPKPAFKNAVVRIIADPATAVAELLAGRVDIVPAFPIDQMKTVEILRVPATPARPTSCGPSSSAWTRWVGPARTRSREGGPSRGEPRDRQGRLHPEAPGRRPADARQRQQAGVRLRRSRSSPTSTTRRWPRTFWRRPAGRRAPTASARRAARSSRSAS